MLARVFIVLSFLLCFGRAARAATFGAVLDNTIYQNVPNNSDGQGPDLYVGAIGTMSGFPGSPRRGLLQFDLSSIPPGSTVTSVTLTLKLTLSAAGTSGTTPISLHQVLSSWGEGASYASAAGGLGVPASPGDATWNYRFYSTTAWKTPGGDFDPAVSQTANVGQVADGSTSTVQWFGSGIGGDVMIADVQEWVNTPGTNFGWILTGDEAGINNARRFASAENPSASLRPVLTVLYTVPEPGAAALLLAGGGCLACRRRRRRK